LLPRDNCFFLVLLSQPVPERLAEIHHLARSLAARTARAARSAGRLMGGQGKEEGGGGEGKGKKREERKREREGGGRRESLLSS